IEIGAKEFRLAEDPASKADIHVDIGDVVKDIVGARYPFVVILPGILNNGVASGVVKFIDELNIAYIPGVTSLYGVVRCHVAKYPQSIAGRDKSGAVVHAIDGQQ